MEQEFTCRPRRTVPQNTWICLEETVSHGKTHERTPHWSRFTGRTCDLMGEPDWSSLFLKDWTMWKGPTLEQSVNCSLWEGFVLEKFMKDGIPW